MSKKGFTIVELLISITLTTVIVLLLTEVIIVIRNIYVSNGIRTKLLTKQAILAKNINDDLLNLDIERIEKCDDTDTCVKFTYKSDGVFHSKKLVINRSKKYVEYDGISTNLISGSTFGNISLYYEKIIGLASGDNRTSDSIFNVEVPIYHNLFEQENFGFNVVYQFNSRNVAVSNVNVTDVVDAEKKIYLVGGDDYKFIDVDYVDPGYYVVDTTDGSVLTSEVDLASGNPLVEITGFVGNDPTETYTLTYTVYNMNHEVMTQVTRTVRVVKSVYTFDLTGETESFTVPVSGTYEIEAWGASGGGTSSMRGKGGYAKDIISLTPSDKVYVTVGGAGSTGTSGTAAEGGFNGGGASGTATDYPASSGGGSTDIRLGSSALASRIIVAGGGGGGGSRSDTSYICNGGAGGGTNGTTGKCSADSYLGGAGTSTKGGAAATFSPSTGTITSAATAGTSLNGGKGATYKSAENQTYAAGGGGGGYYGGGGGARYGGGGGGSGYCKNSTCTTMDGTQTFISPDHSFYEVGHDGSGAVRIALKSVKFGS